MDYKNAREKLRPYLRDYTEQITKKSKGRNMYVCPLCHSGTGTHKTGAFSIEDNGEKWKCFSCGKGGDLFDLIGYYENISDPLEQLNYAADKYRMPEPQKRKLNGIQIHNTDTHKHKAPADTKAEQAADYTQFYKAAAEHLKDTDYMQRRGISAETCKRFNIGYCTAWTHPEYKGKPSPRVIIPTSAESYTARLTTGDSEAKYKNVGKNHPLNIDALQRSEKAIFICEGEIDALSIIEAGGEAIATGGTSNTQQVANLIIETRPEAYIFIAMDNDEPGEKAAAQLAESLKAEQIPQEIIPLYAGYKDANERLINDREGLTDEVANYKIIAAVKLRDLKEKYRKENSAGAYINEFLEGISQKADTPAISTGFKELDRALDGGLYEGLHIMGAISSLGKTAIALQIADQIAAGGHDVLYISLEMSRTELMARSISRLTAQITEQTGGDMRNAKTGRGITDGSRYKTYSAAETELIQAAVKSYAEYAGRLFILEGIGDIGAKQIREAAAQHIQATGSTPVIIVDYLQILAPDDVRATDKQNADKAVLELKRISRDYKTPVIAISSFNRLNYKQAVSMEAFKESGGIEYSSDVLIGLQLKGTGSRDFDIDAALNATPREIEAKILKNRNGNANVTAQLHYYTLFNLIKDAQPC